ncbi:CHAP domain-containing protein, partial [Staphylococcus aureus]
MKKIVTATIATAGLATIAFAGHDAQAAEQNNNGYNSNDAQSY